MLDLSAYDGCDFQPCKKKPVIVYCKQIHEAFKVRSLEGWVIGKPGDYLMRGVKGELYICDRVIFESSYDVINKDVGVKMNCDVEEFRERMIKALEEEE